MGGRRTATEAREQVDRSWMTRALELARAATAQASPNPLVGCVLVRDGVVLGEGAHRYAAYDHAEIVALKRAEAAGVDVAGATAYVTLEPCSHHGRTGPCANALIAAGVKRVVVATVDPNPQVSGRGLERMRGAGIEVEVGVCERESRELNGGFARWIQTRLPMVTLKAALSRDGMLAPPSSARAPGETFWITGAEARSEVQRMRHGADAVLTGIGTVLADDPLLTDRSGGVRRRRLLRVVLDSFARIPVDSKLVRSADGDVLVMCGAGATMERVSGLRDAGVEVMRMEGSGTRLDLHSVVRELGGREMENLLLECGSRLNGAFLQAGSVDRVVLFYAPMELGSEAVPFADGMASSAMLEREIRDVRSRTFGSDVSVEGYLRDPWTGV